MPKVMLGSSDPRETETRAVIAAGMKRAGVNQQQLSKKTGIAQSTLSRHREHPRDMKLGELWDIQDKLKISDEEIAKIFR